MKYRLLLGSLSIGIGLVSFAQTMPKALATRPLRVPFPKGERAPAATFIGVVHVATLVKNDATFNCASGNVTFMPGARPHWHTHAAGQILLVAEGPGCCQEKGQPIRRLHKCEVVQAQPGVEHWHGASPKYSLTRIALNVNAQKGLVDWRRAVTDWEYNSFEEQLGRASAFLSHSFHG